MAPNESPFERIARLEQRMENVREWREEVIEMIQKLDERVRKLERFIWIAFGALAVLQFVSPMVLEKLNGP